MAYAGGWEGEPAWGARWRGGWRARSLSANARVGGPPGGNPGILRSDPDDPARFAGSRVLHAGRDSCSKEGELARGSNRRPRAATGPVGGAPCRAREHRSVFARGVLRTQLGPDRGWAG